MSENIDKQISAWVDGELPERQARELAQRVSQDRHSHLTWERYHLIGDALRGDADGRTAGLADRVMAALEREPTVLRPRRRRRVGPVAGLAAAAAVAAVAVVGVLSLTGGGPGADGAGPASRTVAQVQPVRSRSGTRMEQAVRDQLRVYVADHNQQLAVSGSNGMLPYVRMADFEATPRHK
ncbi:MAG TPA: sigma-E factor negative regulatory protein [Gammaproteobacteria bacterium]|nr:sigma-E factor negative regulatory protein [Gammaproteobacteria bacterium]